MSPLFREVRAREGRASLAILPLQLRQLLLQSLRPPPDGHQVEKERDPDREVRRREVVEPAHAAAPSAASRATPSSILARRARSETSQVKSNARAMPETSSVQPIIG